MQAILKPAGKLELHVWRQPPTRPLTFWEIIGFSMPREGLPTEVNLWRIRNLPNLLRGGWLVRILVARLLRIPHFYSQLSLTVIRDGVRIPYGLASLRVVTTAGVTEVCTRFAGTSAASIANFKFHGFGTGTNAEASSDTSLQTELTTQYATDNTRVTGSQSASTNTYTTIATLSPDSGGTIAITEHGIFSASSSTTLLDRSIFSAVNLGAGTDSLQATYVLTLSAGG